MRTILTTTALIEQMAYDRPGLDIELTTDAAFLTVGGTTWYALLPKVSA